MLWTSLPLSSLLVSKCFLHLEKTLQPVRFILGRYHCHLQISPTGLTFLLVGVAQQESLIKVTTQNQKV